VKKTSVFKKSIALKKQKGFRFGFTLTEMMIVLFIVITISTVSIISFRGGSIQGALHRSAARVVLDLRRAQNLALTSLAYQGGPVFGFGVYFTTSTPGEYIIFADVNGDSIRDPSGAEDFENVKLESGVQISSLTPNSPLSIIYRSPEPTVYICTTSPCLATQSTIGTVELTAPSNPSLGVETITVNDFGLVER